MKTSYCDRIGCARAALGLAMGLIIASGVPAAPAAAARTAPAQALSAPARTGGGLLSLEGGPYRAFGFNRATLRKEDGLPATAKLVGVDWEGARRSLAELETEAYASSAELWFYLDEDIRFLELEAPGFETASLELGREAGIAAGTGADLLRTLPLPLAEPLNRRPAPVFTAGEEGLESIARRAALELQTKKTIPTGLGALLLGLALAFSALGALKPRKGLLLPIIALALAVFGSIGSVLMMPRRAELVVLALPSADPAARLTGGFEGRESREEGFSERRYGEGRALDFLCLSSPASAPLPLELLLGEEWERKGAAENLGFRFRDCPVVLSRSGRHALALRRKTVAWRLYERP